MNGGIRGSPLSPKATKLAQYQTQAALDEASMYCNPEAPPISGPALQKIVHDYRDVQALINRLSRQYPSEVLDSLLNHVTLTPEDLANQEQVTTWTNTLATQDDAHVGKRLANGRFAIGTVGVDVYEDLVGTRIARFDNAQSVQRLIDALVGGDDGGDSDQSFNR